MRKMTKFQLFQTQVLIMSVIVALDCWLDGLNLLLVENLLLVHDVCLKFYPFWSVVERERMKVLVWSFCRKSLFVSLFYYPEATFQSLLQKKRPFSIVFSASVALCGQNSNLYFHVAHFLNASVNRTPHFKKCKQLFEHQHLLLLRDIWCQCYKTCFPPPY